MSGVTLVSEHIIYWSSHLDPVVFTDIYHVVHNRVTDVLFSAVSQNSYTPRFFFLATLY